MGWLSLLGVLWDILVTEAEMEAEYAESLGLWGVCCGQ